MTHFQEEFYPKKDRGNIKIESGSVRVSDPRYTLDVWCAGTIENVVPGEYQCFEFKGNFPHDYGEGKMNDERVAAIEMRLVNDKRKEPIYSEKTDIDVGVDSGQAGFYDTAYFTNVMENSRAAEAWYEKVCDLTYKEWWDHKNIETLLTPEVLEKIKNKLFISKDAEYRAKYGPETLMVLDAHYEAQPETMDNLLKLIIGNFDPEYRSTFHAEMRSGTIDDKGFVASSGFGDGGYDCYVSRNESGQVDALLIVFIYPYKDALNIPQEIISTGYEFEEYLEDPEL